jgi:hypothetical protein
MITPLALINLMQLSNPFITMLDAESEKMRLFSGLKIIARLATIVCFPINMTKVCVAGKACVMHVIESVTGDKPKTF